MISRTKYHLKEEDHLHVFLLLLCVFIVQIDRQDSCTRCVMLCCLSPDPLFSAKLYYSYEVQTY